MTNLLELPAALARFGLTVELVPGWETRGSATFNPGGSVAHHTAGPRTGDRPSLNICINGRADLPGPLCNVFLCRHGHAVVVSARRANHAGPGGWRGLTGNSTVYGTEAESAGTGDWTPEQLWAYPRVHAAYHHLMGTGAAFCCAHREWATPPGRKPDPVGIDMPQFRIDVAKLLADPTGGDDLPTPKDVWDFGIKNQEDPPLTFAAKDFISSTDRKLSDVGQAVWDEAFPNSAEPPMTFTAKDFLVSIDRKLSELIELLAPQGRGGPK